MFWVPSTKNWASKKSSHSSDSSARRTECRDEDDGKDGGGGSGGRGCAARFDTRIPVPKRASRRSASWTSRDINSAEGRTEEEERQSNGILDWGEEDGSRICDGATVGAAPVAAAGVRLSSACVCVERDRAAWM